MSARSLELLLETAYAPGKAPVQGEEAARIYKDFESVHRAARTSPAVATEALNFRFERLRLVIAIALVKAFTRLSTNEKSVEALDVLQDALQAKSTKEIDKVVQKRIDTFDNLYHEIFVNEQREQLLGLFEQTLDAGSKEELDELIFEGLELMQQVDWEANHDEDADDQEPLDEDFLKNL